MTDPIDHRFAELVRRAAPAGRDPLFRLRVMERREQEQFRRRSFLMLGLVLAVVAAATAILASGPVRLEAPLVLLFGLLASSAAVLSAAAYALRIRLSRM